MPFEPQNELEQLLMRASEDPAARPAFYRALVAADLFVIDNNPAPSAPVDGVLEPGSMLSLSVLEIEGVPHVLLFSALERIAQVVGEEVKYVRMNGRDLLELVRGGHLVLNPGSDYGKQLVPEEVEAILDGSIHAQRDTFVVEEATRVLLGQPAEYPSHVTDALCGLFRSKKNVTAAYLTQCVFPDDPKPHIVIGIDCKDGWDPLMQDVRETLGRCARGDEIIDCIEMDDSGIACHMRDSTKPFYRKKRFGLF